GAGRASAIRKISSRLNGQQPISIVSRHAGRNLVSDLLSPPGAALLIACAASGRFRMRHVHLVGSVPLKDARDVFETVSAALGDRLKRIPDGETGERSDWITWLE